jgi:hypothetical protein
MSSKRGMKNVIKMSLSCCYVISATQISASFEIIVSQERTSAASSILAVTVSDELNSRKKPTVKDFFGHSQSHVLSN